jgi:hypothetical protein
MRDSAANEMMLGRIVEYDCGEWNRNPIHEWRSRDNFSSASVMRNREERAGVIHVPAADRKKMKA